MKFIYHLADIHIGSSDDRSKEYRAVFDKLTEEIRDYAKEDNTLVVIAGDIFHHKTRLSAQDISDFNYLMEGLKSVQVIIIPGNHDLIDDNRDKMDLITPLTRDYGHITYLKDTGIYDLFGLRFVHISVYDKYMSLEDIRALSDAAGPGFILLYHGMVDGAQFGGYTIKDSQITEDIISRAHLVLLGDVHQHQFIKPWCAYPGSLIQQNLGEDFVKGIIDWDIEERTGKFVRIENPKGFLRIDARGKTLDEIKLLPRPADIKKLSLITDVGDAEAGELVRAIEQEYGRVDKIATVLTKQIQLNTAETQMDALRDILVNMKAAPDDIIEILDMHRPNIIEVGRAKWHVKSLKWDNLFKYGKGNYLDFTRLEGIAGVIAENRAGKSSILDILVFGLFGEPLRGSKKSIIRYGQKESYLKVEFVVNRVEYYVERTDLSSHSRVRIGFYRKDEDKWINLTEKAIDETYRTIKQIIGGLEEFLSTGLFYDGLSVDILRMKPTSRKELFGKLFGIQNTDLIIKEAKQKKKEYEIRLDQLVKPRRTDIKADYDKLAIELDDLSNDKIAAEEKLAALDKASREILAELSSVRDASELSQLLATEEAKLHALDNKIAGLEGQITRRVFDAPAVRYNRADLMLLINQEYSVAELSNKLELLTSRLPKNSREVKYSVEELNHIRVESEANIREIAAQIALIGDVAPMSELTERLTKVNADLSDLRMAKRSPDNRYLERLYDRQRDAKILIEELEANRRKLVAEQDEIAESTSVKDLTAELDKISNEMDYLSRQFVLVNLESLIALKSKVSSLEQESQFRFNSDCECCNTNINVLANELAAARVELSATEARVNGIVESNSRVAAELDTKRQIKEQLEGRLMRAKRQVTLEAELSAKDCKLSEARRELTQIDSEALQIESECVQIAAENSRLDALIDVEMGQLEIIRLSIERAGRKADLSKSEEIKKRQLNETLQDIEAYDTVRIFNDVNGMINETRDHLAIARRSDEARAKLEQLDLYEQSVLNNQLLELRHERTRAADMGAAIKREWERALELEPRREMLASNEIAIRDLKVVLSATIEAIGSKQAYYDMLEKELEIERAYNEQAPDLMRAIRRYKLYIDSVGNKGLILSVVAKFISAIVSKVNNILEYITDFTLTHSTDDAQIEFFINEGVRKLPAEMGSGFQRFILSIALRLALTSALPSSAEFICIDEGFGCMDKMNLSKVGELFQSIKPMYKFIFLISHIDDLNSLIENPIRISKRDEESYINNGPRGDGMATDRVDQIDMMMRQALVELDDEKAAGGVPKDVARGAMKGAAKGAAKEVAKEVPEGKILCECGKIVAADGLAKHKKTQMHINRLKK